ncbi:MAG TPA: hypothetical protein PLV21_06635 [Cyclobacteriaceae bacterium]|mgnify:CR=1 FL=1|nr:hypothetical protein [Cyclobacteriaceae bacterium]HRJ81539.1 hypothetical protein [Cyclobacteriaceae bacterium]
MDKAMQSPMKFVKGVPSYDKVEDIACIVLDGSEEGTFFEDHSESVLQDECDRAAHDV